MSTRNRIASLYYRTKEKLKRGRGQQTLLLYVNMTITQPPVDRLNSNFAYRAQMGSSFFEIIFFVLTLFGRHEANLPLPLFLRQETSNITSPMHLA